MKSKNKQLKVCANTERISYTGLLPAKDLFIQGVISVVPNWSESFVVVFASLMRCYFIFLFTCTLSRDLTPAVMEAAVGKLPQPWGWHICVKWKFILSCTDGPTGCYHMVAGYIDWMEYFSFLQLIVVVFWTQMLLFHSPSSSLLFTDRKQIKLATPWSI